VSALPGAVLFDMDGTLIDSEGLWLAAEIEVMASLGADWTQADQAHCLGGPLERVADYMIARSGADMTPEEVGTALLDGMEHRLRSTPLTWQPGARDLLDEVRSLGIPTALVSASWSRLIRAVADHVAEDLGPDVFDVVVAGDDVSRSKPHPEPYLTAARLADVDPARCLVIEDSPTGVASGAAAGCTVVAVPHIATIEVPGVLVVDSLAGWSVAALWRAALSA
jgi:HAD superfamily hydrolase (TIGR01509 family)